MINLTDLKLGFSDAENYHRRENKTFFNTVFVKNRYLNQLLEPNRFFLMGDKGTGKTAYAVFLSNNEYQNTISDIKYIRETDYEKFIHLKEGEHLQLSDYVSIWKVILLLLISNTIKKSELDENAFTKNKKFNSIKKAIDEYYHHAFAPEVTNVLNFVENSKEAAEIVFKHLKIAGEMNSGISFQESKFQTNLMFIQRQFEESLRNIKLTNNHILFIDGIDIRPHGIEYKNYLECIKGLTNAVWSLNNDFFPSIRDSKGRFKIVLLLRPDIFISIGLQNTTNKIRDNAIYLDWRTTYPTYADSLLFEVSDNLLAAQQKNSSDKGIVWNSYLPWQRKSTNENREYDGSFISFLRFSYSRPRDIITMLQILHEEHDIKNLLNIQEFDISIFEGHQYRNKLSEYYMGSIRDQISFYYTNEDYEFFLKFFQYLNGKTEFSYQEYAKAYNKFIDNILEYHSTVPEFSDNEDKFLQFLYDINILCYIEYGLENPYIRWCYRERDISNINPKVKIGVFYRIHPALQKALNVGMDA